MVQPVQVRPVSNDEGNRLLRIVRRGTGSVVTWRRAQMVLLSAQRMPVANIAEVTFTSPDRVRDVLHNFNTDGFDSLYPRYAGGRLNRPGFSGGSVLPARPRGGRRSDGSGCPRSRRAGCRRWRRGAGGG